MAAEDELYTRLGLGLRARTTNIVAPQNPKPEKDSYKSGSHASGPGRAAGDEPKLRRARQRGAEPQLPPTGAWRRDLKPKPPQSEPSGMTPSTAGEESTIRCEGSKPGDRRWPAVLVVLLGSVNRYAARGRTTGRLGRPRGTTDLQTCTLERCRHFVRL